MKTSKEIDSKYSKTFCVYPWVHQMINQHGDFQLCCSANTVVLKSDGVDNNVRNDSLSDVWNNDDIKSIRKRMLSGEKISNCEHCYYLESIGFKSWREEANEGWFTWHNKDEVLENLIKQSIDDSYNVSQTPSFIDVRFGSKCNLACRMCEPKSSTLLLKDFKKVHDNTPKNNKRLSDLVSLDAKDEINISSPWVDNPNLWKNLNEAIPTLKRVYLAGGEPFITDQNERLIDEIISSGRANQIMIQINTNGTVFSKSICQKLKCFGQVYIMLSLDGVGRTQEYIRYPSKWSHMEKNITKYLNFMTENQNVSLYLCIVTQSLNVFNFRDFLKFAAHLIKDTSEDCLSRFTINPIPLSMPSHYRVENIPTHMKQRATDEIRHCIDMPILEKFPSFKSLLTSLADVSLKTPTDDDEVKFFIDYNSELDRTRNIHIKDYLPDIHAMLTEKLTYPD